MAGHFLDRSNGKATFAHVIIAAPFGHLLYCHLLYYRLLIHYLLLHYPCHLGHLGEGNMPG